MTISSLSDGDVNLASFQDHLILNFFKNERIILFCNNELSLCQDRIASIFSLIERNFKKVESKLLEES